MNDNKFYEYLNQQVASYSLFKHIIIFNNDTIYENDNINKRLITTLFHEYFHYYIQFNSLFNIEGYLHYFSLIKEIYNNKHNINQLIPVVKNIDKLNEPKKFRAAYDYYSNWILRKGDNFKNSNHRTSMLIKSFNKNNKSIYLPFKMGKTYIPKIFVAENERSNIIESFNFGEIAINESLANLIQSFLKLNYDGTIPNSPLLPYQIFSYLMYQKKYYELLPLIIIADLSMQTPSPGYTFLILEKKYEKILKNKYSEKNYLKLIQQLKDIYKNEVQSGICKEYLQQIEKLLLIYLKNSINNNPFFEWIYNKFENGFKRVQSGELPYYLLPMFGEEELEKKLIKLFSIFTPPVIADKQTKSTSQYILFSHFNRLVSFLSILHIDKNSIFHMRLEKSY